MAKVNSTVLKETRYIAVFSLVLSLLMQAVFLIVLRRFDYTVLLGNLLGFITGVGNFFFMGIGVQKAVEKDEKGAKNVLKFSQTARFFAIFVIAAIGITLDSCFNAIAVIVPLFFPRIAIAARGIKKN
ncbi:MAG: hypothetical protein J5852_01970 [Clostridia bacterium]|nr:hypothetical protein [Clostridia bacterium]